MSVAPSVIPPQSGPEITGCWQGVPLTGSAENARKSPPARLMSQDVSSSGDEYSTTKVRKPYTITKQRERWTENEHEKFLEALKLYGRAWRRIEEHIGTKTAVQIRSHAQKFFSKVEREVSTGGSSTKLQDVEIPPPRPKRKPMHPYPRKAGTSPSFLEEEIRSCGVSSSCPSTDDHHHQSVPVNRINCQVTGAASYAGSKGGSPQKMHGNPLRSANILEPQESLKLFGKTVVLLTTPRKVADQKGSQESLSMKGDQTPVPRTTKPALITSGDLKYKVGFSPYVKAGKTTKLHSGGDVSSSNNNASQQGLSNVERIEDSTVDVCGTVCKLSNDTVDKNSSSPSTGKAMLAPKQGVALKSIPHDNSTEEEPPTSLVDDHCKSQIGPQNNPAYLWMDRFFSSYGNVPILPHTESLSASPPLPWNLLQASAMNQSAAYAAAAAARWALVSGTRASIGPLQHLSNGFNEGGGHSVPPSLAFPDHQFNAAAFAAVAASWWAFRGLLPPTPPSFVHLPAVVAGTQMSSCVDDAPCSTELGGSAFSGKTVDNRMAMNEGAAAAQDIEQTTEPATHNELTSSESFMDPENEDATEMDGDTVSPSNKGDQQRSCSSGDELEEEGMDKKRAEGSSSGSNTPVLRSNSSEPETPNTSGSDVKHTDKSYDRDRAAADSNGSPETASTKLNSMEKGKKHAYRDSKNGETDNGKRLKSCIHDTDLRKEVSQEGRKAFQALFVSKTLPQTFPVKGSPPGSIGAVTDKHVAKPSTMNTTDDSSCCHEEGELPKTSPALPRPTQSDRSTGAQAKAFSIYSRPGRSGFVPYQRPHAKHQAPCAPTKSKS